ncbi:peptidase M24, structural domain-containing protein [Powellomyces hirtus]|nr:peptidase M24, structural domain-containing protein [Powellomyces hirtus]
MLPRAATGLHRCAAAQKVLITPALTNQHVRLFTWAATLLQRRRAPTLLSPAARLTTFGQYELILPPPESLTGQVLRQTRNEVPETIQRPEYDAKGHPLVFLHRPHLKTPEEITGMRASCALAKQMLDFAIGCAVPGVTTSEIDCLGVCNSGSSASTGADSVPSIQCNSHLIKPCCPEVHEKIIQSGAYPSPLGYLGFPKSICTSINNVICHGIPDARSLKDGDIVNIDITVYLNGFHGDTSATVLIGDVDEKGKKLVLATKEAMEKAISICKPGVPLNEIGRLISEYAESSGFTTCPDFSGHGIGRQFHEPPMIYHFRNSDSGVMEENMIFTIEPMLCQGGAGHVKWPDNWTAVTRDGGRSAQFEHTVLITRDGVDILTSK